MNISSREVRRFEKNPSVSNCNDHLRSEEDEDFTDLLLQQRTEFSPQTSLWYLFNYELLRIITENVVESVQCWRIRTVVTVGRRWQWWESMTMLWTEPRLQLDGPEVSPGRELCVQTPNWRDTGDSTTTVNITDHLYQSVCVILFYTLSSASSLFAFLKVKTNKHLLFPSYINTKQVHPAAACAPSMQTKTLFILLTKRVWQHFVIEPTYSFMILILVHLLLCSHERTATTCSLVSVWVLRDVKFCVLLTRHHPFLLQFL